jgi:hypothetical protein
LFWLLHDSASFFHAYGRYRDRLVSLLRQLSGKPSARQDNERLAHTIDVIHGCYFGREIDTGIINHAAELLIDGRAESPNEGMPVQSKPTIEPDDSAFVGNTWALLYLAQRRSQRRAKVRDLNQQRGDRVSKLRGRLPVQSVAQRVELENVSLQICGNDIRLTETMLSESSLGCLPRSICQAQGSGFPKGMPALLGSACSSAPPRIGVGKSTLE